MDWILADGIVAPEGSEQLFSERVYRLPHAVFCYAPEEDYPLSEDTDTQKPSDRPITFGSFNNVPKLTPHTLTLWADILRAIPGSRLLLKAPSFKDDTAQRAFQDRLGALGVDLARIEFRGPSALTEMMSEYRDIDIALDPVPYNGGTTTLQALWMGVPVVVKAGGNFVSRMGASLMTGAGLSDWIAQSDEDYVAIACRIAEDREKLPRLKKNLRSPLGLQPAWNIAAYTRDFENALIEMWESSR